MLKLSTSLFEIETHNHLVARLFERTQASKVAKRNKWSNDYASQYDHDFSLFKHLAVLEKQPVSCRTQWEVK